MLRRAGRQLGSESQAGRLDRAVAVHRGDGKLPQSPRVHEPRAEPGWLAQGRGPDHGLVLVICGEVARSAGGAPNPRSSGRTRSWGLADAGIVRTIDL